MGQPGRRGAGGEGRRADRRQQQPRRCGVARQASAQQGKADCPSGKLCGTQLDGQATGNRRLADLEKGGRGCPFGAGFHCLDIECAGTGRGSYTRRSEEHTSELQSLIRTSYAVSCLTKKTNATPTTLLADVGIRAPRTHK